MKNYGRASVGEILGDNIVYRNLTPMDTRLPGLGDLRAALEIPPDVTPRKTSQDYARVMASILSAARQLEAPGVPIERVIFVGDTRLNDSTAFANICRAGSWPGIAFIGAEKGETPHIEIEPLDVGSLMAANRWAALREFKQYCAEYGFPVDEKTAVLLDLDKTTLGARGRNDKVIDLARVEAATQTARSALGEEFDLARFETPYHLLNQPEFHPFTRDNQDYLVYICLILGSGLIDFDALVAEVRAGNMESFEQFIDQVEARKSKLSLALQEIHRDVFYRVQQKDPTPFKAFRYNEFRATVARLGQMEAGTSVGELLSQEIVITHEVRELMLAWKKQGALVFGLSDKPDEASIPTPELASQGYLSIHRIETDMVGEQEADS